MWEIEEKNDHFMVIMNTNRQNRMNREFLTDLHQTLDTLRAVGGLKPILLTSGSESAFSVGLDFDSCFELFGRRDHKEIAEWFEFFRTALLKVYEYPGKIVAAVSGHAFAGGLILALACDFRIGVNCKTRFSLNEVPIGIPMPAVFSEMIRQKVGEQIALDTILTGRIFNEQEALRMGFLNKLVKPNALLSSCLREIRALSPDAWQVYAHTKRLLLTPSLQYIRGMATSLDEESVRVISSSSAISAQRSAMAKLKRSENLARNLAK